MCFLASASVGAFLFLRRIFIMNVTSDMYTKLFNELTDIMKEIENIKERIKKVQIETEEIYINNEM